MIINRPAASTWSFLGVNGSPGLETNSSVSLGYGLGDISEHAAPNIGVRGAASAFQFAVFGGFPTFQLSSLSPGGAMVQRIRTNLGNTSQTLLLLQSETPWPWSAAPPVSNPVVETGIGAPESTFESDVDGNLVGVVGTTPGIMFLPPGYNFDLEIFVPSGHHLIAQGPALGIGNVTFEWMEWPES